MTPKERFAKDNPQCVEVGAWADPTMYDVYRDHRHLLLIHQADGSNPPLLRIYTDTRDDEGEVFVEHYEGGVEYRDTILLTVERARQVYDALGKWLKEIDDKAWCLCLEGIVPGAVLITGKNPHKDLEPEARYEVMATEGLGRLYVIDRRGRRHCLFYVHDGSLRGYDNVGGWAAVEQKAEV